MRTRGSAVVIERPSGVLDTSTYIDLDLLHPGVLPDAPGLTTITLAELHHGLVAARDAMTRELRTAQVAAAVVDFDPLPFLARYLDIVEVNSSFYGPPTTKTPVGLMRVR